MTAKLLLLRRFFPVLLLAAALPLQAQYGSVAGRVFEADGGAPVADCNVVLIPVGDYRPAGRASCDANGEFELSTATPGSYHLVAMRILSQDYARSVYGHGSCNDTNTPDLCRDVGDGTPIVVREGETSGFFEIGLERLADLHASVQLAGAGPDLAPTGRLRVFEDDREEIKLNVLGLPEQSFDYRLAPGRYRLVVEGDPDWESVAWGGAPCSRWYCDPALAEPIDLAAGGVWSGSTTIEPVAPYAGCTPDATTLCLNQGRFEVRAIWGDYFGVSGAGIAQQKTADTGYFYFFAPNNVEVLVKALDACEQRFGHRFWFFAGGLTDVGVELRVKDTLTGDFQLYTNRLGTTFDPILDTEAFATCGAQEPAPWTGPAAAAALAAAPRLAAPEPLGPCDLSPTPRRACLADGRFAVSATYTQPGQAPSAAEGILLTGDTAAFWFFHPDNYEVMVKVLDACSTSTPGFWVFGAGLTDVPVEVKVEDLATGRIKTYARGPGPFAPIVDHSSFPCR